jgi:pimeloyl-ACP methyl ester carboxylesterase
MTVPVRLVGGRPVAIREIGEGVPILFLHGFGVDHVSLLSSAASVFERRSGYRRLHVDLPGFGASPADPSIDSSDAAVDFVLELIDEVIGDERFLLVGQSWGAYLARAVIAERRDRILGVALDIPVVIATHADRDVAPSLILREEPGILDGVGLIDAGEFRQVAVIIDGPAWDSFATTILPAESVADDPTLERIGQRYAFTTDVDDIGEPFDRPSLIVVGRQDSVVGYRDALRLVERFPRSTFAILDAAGHLLEGERPELFAALVDDWIDRVERT